MTGFPLTTGDDVAANCATLQGLRAKLGLVPNMARMPANAPVAA